MMSMFSANSLNLKEKSYFQTPKPGRWHTAGTTATSVCTTSDASPTPALVPFHGDLFATNACCCARISACPRHTPFGRSDRRQPPPSRPSNGNAQAFVAAMRRVIHRGRFAAFAPAPTTIRHANWPQCAIPIPEIDPTRIEQGHNHDGGFQQIQLDATP